MMQGKKYYSISEVTEILQIHPHKLRYLENKVPTLVIQKIKNRRYYTKEDIKFLSELAGSITSRKAKVVSKVLPEAYSYSLEKLKLQQKNTEDFKASVGSSAKIIWPSSVSPSILTEVKILMQRFQELSVNVKFLMQ